MIGSGVDPHPVIRSPGSGGDPLVVSISNGGRHPLGLGRVFATNTEMDFVKEFLLPAQIHGCHGDPGVNRWLVKW